LLDIGRHILAKKGLGRPNKYRDIIVFLGKQGILPADFARRIEGMAGYRNRLVHGYAEVSAEEIYNIIKTRLADFESFCKIIVQYVESEKKREDSGDIK